MSVKDNCRCKCYKILCAQRVLIHSHHDLSYCTHIYYCLYLSVQLVERELVLHYSCGSGPVGVLPIKNRMVADGLWHHISLEVNKTMVKLTVDEFFSFLTLPGPCRLTQASGILMFANTSHTSQGLRGCLNAIHFNGQPVRSHDGLGTERNRLYGRYECCKFDGCASNPCENGVTCEEDSNGGEH